MIVINDGQMESMSVYMLEQFEDRMVVHLRKHWPKKCAALGEDAVRESIRKGVQRARSYGITSEYDVSRYVNCMYALCHDFDTDPRAPWAQPILTDAELPASSKMNRVCEHTRHELKTRADKPGRS